MSILFIQLSMICRTINKKDRCINFHSLSKFFEKSNVAQLPVFYYIMKKKILYRGYESWRKWKRDLKEISVIDVKKYFRLCFSLLCFRGLFTNVKKVYM